MSFDVLVIGYGNTLRGDDGIGPAVAEDVAALGLPGVRVIVAHQLTPELAAEMTGVRHVVFVDSTIRGEGVRVVRIESEPASTVMTHAADPRGLMALCEVLEECRPEAWLVTAAGVDFGFREGLSPTGRENARRALASVERLVRESSGA